MDDCQKLHNKLSKGEYHPCDINLRALRVEAHDAMCKHGWLLAGESTHNVSRLVKTLERVHANLDAALSEAAHVDSSPENGAVRTINHLERSIQVTMTIDAEVPSGLVNLDSVRSQVCQHFPDLWPAAEAGLSTCATLLLSDNVNPVALIYVGPPSAGKTTVVSMFDGATVKGEKLCYRSDKFTTAAFVTQSAKVAAGGLKKVDLLPRIKHKVLLTPDLSTIFRGKQEELAERFSTLTRVLDGQGYITDSAGIPGIISLPGLEPLLLLIPSSGR